MSSHDTTLGDRPGIGTPAYPYAEDAQSILNALSVDPAQGLGKAEVAQRLAQFGENELRHRPRVNAILLVLNQFRSPVVYLLIAAAMLALALGEFVEFAAIAIVLLINSAIGFITELQATRSMEALRELTSPTVPVRRNGIVAPITAETLVPGDIVVLDAGDIVAADLRILESANLAADESPLTGESFPVPKSAQPNAPDTILAERHSMLFKGCAIARGTGEAVVTGTGMNTELGQITRLVQSAEPDRSPLEVHLDRLSRDLIWLTLGVTAIVAIVGIVTGHDLVLMLKASIALAVAAIPEGLPIVATLALARGMLRMAKHNALIEQLSAVETLGATTVILTDKTGTLTENRMHVDRIVLADGEYVFDHNEGKFLLGGHPVSAQADDALTNLLQTAALCNNASCGGDDSPPSGDPMEIALLEAARGVGLERSALLDRFPEVTEHAFDASTRMMATVHRDGSAFEFAVKGAPEAVLESVIAVQDHVQPSEFDDTKMKHWESVCQLLASQGLRLLAIAIKSSDRSDAAAYEGLTFLGIVGFQDPPRPDIASAIGDARRAGISVVMVTGDHAATAQHISENIGLSERNETVIEGKDLEPLSAMTDAERDRVRKVRVFSRVNPEQKLELITLHQKAGEVVAMTGDGVNDAPALRKADIGIAMGLRGTQVAKEASDLVLRDDAFSTIIIAVKEGRTIFTNIRRFATYLLSCNLSEVLVIGLAVLVGLPLPLLPLQILFLNLVTDVFPAFALGTIKADANVLGRPPRRPTEPILAKKQWIAIFAHGASISMTTLVALVSAIYGFGLTGDSVTTMCFFTLALAQLWHVFNMRNWREGLFSSPVMGNSYVWLAVIVCLLILTMAYFQPGIALALHLVPLPGDAWYLILGLSIVPVLMRQVAAWLAHLHSRP